MFNKNQLSQLLSEGDYFIPGPHFEIGKSLHTSNFYYAKKYFQSTENSDGVAEALLEKLWAMGIDFESHTFVGFGSYAGLFLNRIVREIKIKRPKLKRLNYALVDKDADGFVFSYLPKLHQNVIVFMPITRTFERFFKLKEYIHGRYKEVKVNPEFFSVFLVLDESLYDVVEQTRASERFVIEQLERKDTKELYQAYNWSEIGKDKVLFKNIRGQDQENLNTFKANYIEAYPSRLYLADKCSLCFPHKKEGQSTLTYGNEQPLVQTTSNHDSLKIIFGLPKYMDAFTQKAGEATADRRTNQLFHELFDNKGYEYTHLYGHLTFQENSYLNFIQRDIFYQKNKEAILDFFHGALKEIVTVEHKDIVIISPGNFKSSGFLEDLIYKGSLGNNKVSVIPYHPHREYLENFIDHYGELLSRAYSLIYFDDVISEGRTFKLISDYLKNARNSFPQDNKALDKGFDYVFTLIDRSTQFNKREIRRKLATRDNMDAKGLFIAFYKLNVPQIDSSHIGNPIKEKADNLNQLFNDSYLDGLKLFVAREVEKSAPKKIESLISEYKRRASLRYFPFCKSSKGLQGREVYRLYARKYTFEVRNLLKLHLFHQISAWIQDRGIFGAAELKDLLEDLQQLEKRNLYFNFYPAPADSEFREHETEKRLVRETAFKILSRPPFRDYKDIYQPVFDENSRCFSAVLDKLCAHHNPLSTKGGVTEGLKRIMFTDFQELKTCIKRSVELNSNFIISKYFLMRIKEVFFNEQELINYYQDKINQLDKQKAYDKRLIRNYTFQSEQVIKFKYFLLNCYKELIFKNPSRSIVLEGLLNDKDLLPRAVAEFSPQKMPELSAVINDAYYQLVRLLKSENVFLINELKSRQLKENEFVNKVIKSKYKLDAFHGKGKEFIKKLVYGLLNRKLDTADEGFLAHCMGNAKVLRRINDIISPKDGATTMEISQQVFKLKEVLIKEWYYEKYRNDSIAAEEATRQAKIFFEQSGFATSRIGPYSIKHAMLSMLYTVSLLKNYKHIRDSEPNGKRPNENTFTQELKKILRPATEIVGPDLDYAFFIEYRELEGKNDEQENIYITSSDDSQDNVDLKLDKKGLIYNMLYGLEDYPGGNMQTFLAIAKDEQGGIHSLKNEYFQAGETSMKHYFDAKADKDNVVLASQILADEFNGEFGVKVIKDATMLLLFRFALIEQNASNSAMVSKGQAVLAICSKEPVNAKSFYDFANIERMRLLLLIKEQMLDYLRKQFESDAFISVLEDRKIFQFQSKLSHGIENYSIAIASYRRRITTLIKDNLDNLSTEEQFQQIMDNMLKTEIVTAAVLGQARGAIDSRPTPKLVKAADFRHKMKVIFEDDYLGSKSMLLEDVKLPENFPAEIDKLVYDVVIPELIINQKKYALLDEGKLITIDFQSGVFTFTNYVEIGSKKQALKRSGGLDMCNNILNKLGVGTLEFPQDSDPTIYIVKLNLNSKSDEN